MGKLAQVQEWSSPDADATVHNRSDDAPLRIELVEREFRDIFVLNYSQASKKIAQERNGSRPLRLAIAINSWHEMPMSEYMWYYKEFIAGPDWHMAADWVFYVSNVEWNQNAKKQELLLGPGP